jgi:hypothetical protein
MITEKDQEQIHQQGISEKKVQEQIENFRKGFPFLEITEPAVVGRGIIRLECEEVDDLVEIYKGFEGSRMKFVPASGAATRMFKHLFEFVEEYPTKGEECFVDKSINSVYYFIDNIKQFAFYQSLKDELWKSGFDIDALLESRDFVTLIKILLNPEGLNYGNLPKGLLKFHKYPDGSRTAMEEHLVEGSQYARSMSNHVHIHLTVSPEHRKGFEMLASQVLSMFEEAYRVTFHLTYSEQKKSTDTIAVDANNEPFRNSDGTLVFRPGGHGALIENLNDLNAELIFIKNIDNVVPDNLKPQTVVYKKALAGLLISYQSLIFDYLSQLQGNEELTHDFLQEVLQFTIDELCIIPPKDLNLKNPQQLLPYLIGKLNRPIRVCGMVKNEGEPGGGPFWAKNADGSVSLQIVESSQIDMNDTKKKKIVSAATHFNPVDLICGITDADGSKYDLLKYTDPTTGFISIKSKDGKMLKAQELPGLWNGAMANWNTIFVEVPLITFNPVKTVNDLLRDQHQG